MTTPVTPDSPFLPNWQQIGDEDVAKVLERHLPWIQSFVHKKLGAFRRSKADTGDLVQEAIVQFLKHGPRIKLSNDNQFRALLCKIIENAVCDKYAWFTAQRRDMAKERPLPPDTLLNLDPPRGRQETPSRIVQRQEQEAWARLGIELLNPDEREVIILRKWKELTFQDIGDHLGLSKEGARKRYFRALNNLIETVRNLQSGEIEAAIGFDISDEK